MSCKDFWDKQVAGRLEEATRIARGQVDGAARCAYPGCGLPINLSTGVCPVGHRTALAQFSQPYPAVVDALLCFLDEHDVDNVVTRREGAMAIRLRMQAMGEEGVSIEMGLHAPEVFALLTDLVRTGTLNDGSKVSTQSPEGAHEARRRQQDYAAVVAALAKAYGHARDWGAAEVRQAVDADLVPPLAAMFGAAGDLCRALETEVALIGIAPQKQGEARRVLARAYGVDNLPDQEIWGMALRACRDTAAQLGERADENPVRLLLGEVDALREQREQEEAGKKRRRKKGRTADIERDPRVQAARAYLRELDRTWWEAPSYQEALAAWPGEPSQMFAEGLYQVAGVGLAIDDGEDEEGNAGLELVWSPSEPPNQGQDVLAALRSVFVRVTDEEWAQVREGATDDIEALCTLRLPNPAARWQELQAVRMARDVRAFVGGLSEVVVRDLTMATELRPRSTVVHLVVRNGRGEPRDHIVEHFTLRPGGEVKLEPRAIKRYNTAQEARAAMGAARPTTAEQQCVQCGVFLGGRPHVCPLLEKGPSWAVVNPLTGQANSNPHLDLVGQTYPTANRGIATVLGPGLPFPDTHLEVTAAGERWIVEGARLRDVLASQEATPPPEPVEE